MKRVNGRHVWSLLLADVLTLDAPSMTTGQLDNISECASYRTMCCVMYDCQYADLFSEYVDIDMAIFLTDNPGTFNEITPCKNTCSSGCTLVSNMFCFQN